jgi:hypothetical protein
VSILIQVLKMAFASVKTFLIGQRTIRRMFAGNNYFSSICLLRWLKNNLLYKDALDRCRNRSGNCVYNAGFSYISRVLR